MTIRKKTPEELQTQAEGFLEFMEKEGRRYLNKGISKATRQKISETLGLSETDKKGFFEWLSKKFGKELDISDEEKIKKIFSRKKFDFRLFSDWVDGLAKSPFKSKYGVNFGNLWEEYRKYIACYKKATHILEKYESINSSLSKFIFDFLFESFYENRKINLSNLKVFLESNAYKQSTLKANDYGDILYSENLFDFLKTICEYNSHKFYGKDKFVKILNGITDEEFKLIMMKAKHNKANDESVTIFNDKEDMDEYLEFKKHEKLFESCGFGLEKFLDAVVVTHDKQINMYEVYKNQRRKFLNGLENIKFLYEKFGESWKEYFYKSKDILHESKPENLKTIFEKYHNLNLEELNKIKDILSKVQYPKILDLVFEKYPDITIDKLNTLSEVLIGMRMSNWMWFHRRYPNINIETIKELKDILSENTSVENLTTVTDKYPDITIKELIKFSNLLNRRSSSALYEVFNFGNKIPSSKSLNILDLFNDYTKKHDEIFKNIENKDEINGDNWVDITGLYSAIEYFEDDKTISEEIKVKIKELLQSEESKDIIYKKLSELLKKSLDDNYELANEEIALLAVLNKKGLWNMGQSESLAKFIYQINKLDKNYKYSKVFSEIKGDIKKFIYSHKKDSNELINSFYQVSTSLLERSPAIYRNVVKLLNKIDSKGQEIFYKEIFPLYNVELFLGENPGHYKLLGKKVDNDAEGQLIPMHERVKMLLNKLEFDKQIDINSLLLEEKSYLVENIKQLFKEKFGIKKIPNEFSKENIESIRWHSIYLSNMNDRDEEKSAVLGYYLALKLNGKRSEFRAGKDFDPSEYMEDSKVYILREYLSKRSERNSVYKLQDIEEEDKAILQENESNTIIGNTNGITDRLNTIESNIRTLLDDDIYSERQKIIKKYIDKDLGKLLAKQFQKLSGKNIIINDGENEILTDLSNELREDLSDIKNVQKLQNECKPISAIVNFVNKILNENLPKEIQDFENLSKPSNEHLELLKKIGINLEEGLIVSSNSYLTYIESGIRKGKNKLTQEEYNSLNEYLVGLNKELTDLYGIKDKLTSWYEDFKNKIIDKYFDNTELKKRFESMSPYFFTKADVEKENIVSLMTNDLDIVIKNIRQCLGCKDKGCNNDTDLSFGCDDRFFITTSHREGDTSFADELVTLLPREPKEEGFTFVMDRIYGNNGSIDILLNNINVIIKKINKLSPKLRKQLSIFVPDNIELNLNEEGIEKIKKQYNGIIIEKKDITVSVEEQPITDSYHEFGGIDCRSTGYATISGHLIKFE